MIDQIFSHISNCLLKISTCMSYRYLRINRSKSKLIILPPHPNLFSLEFSNSVSDNITSHHTVLLCYSAQMLMSGHYPLTSINGNLTLSKLTWHFPSHQARTCLPPAFPKWRRGHKICFLTPQGHMPSNPIHKCFLRIYYVPDFVLGNLHTSSLTFTMTLYGR